MTEEKMRTLEEIKRILAGHKEELTKRYRIREIGIFGSFARGEQKKKSDIDILVEYDEGDIPDLLKFVETERYLQSLLGRKVDLVRKDGIRPELKNIILKEVEFVYGAAI